MYGTRERLSRLAFLTGPAAPGRSHRQREPTPPRHHDDAIIDALAEKRQRGEVGAHSSTTEIAERIRQMREVNDLSYRAICATLDAEGASTARGAGAWNVGAIQGAFGYNRPKRRRAAELPRSHVDSASLPVGGSLSERLRASFIRADFASLSARWCWLDPVRPG